jgi:hypothetical protein
MINRFISSLTGRDSKSATDSAGEVSSSLTSPAHHLSDEARINLILRQYYIRKAMAALDKAQFEKEC